MTRRCIACIALTVIIAAGLGLVWYGVARAAEQPPPGRQWAIERCQGEQCEVLGWRYSGPTACAVDAQSERVGKQMPAAVRLSCIRIDGGKR